MIRSNNMGKKRNLDIDKIQEEILGLSDEAALRIVVNNKAIGASSDWQYSTQSANIQRDEDGFLISNPLANRDETDHTRGQYQTACWNLFHKNPLVNTSVRGLVGRLVG